MPSVVLIESLRRAVERLLYFYAAAEGEETHTFLSLFVNDFLSDFSLVDAWKRGVNLPIC